MGKLALEKTIGFLLGNNYFLILSLLTKRFIECKADVTVEQWYIMLNIQTNGTLSQNEIAAIKKINKSGVKRLLEPLETKSFVSIEHSESDARVHIVSLSESGKIKLKQLNSIVKTVVEDILEIFSDEESKTLHSLLEKLSKHLESINKKY